MLKKKDEKKKTWCHFLVNGFCCFLFGPNLYFLTYTYEFVKRYFACFSRIALGSILFKRIREVCFSHLNVLARNSKQIFVVQQNKESDLEEIATCFFFLKRFFVLFEPDPKQQNVRPKKGQC